MNALPTTTLTLCTARHGRQRRDLAGPRRASGSRSAVCPSGPAPRHRGEHPLAGAQTMTHAHSFRGRSERGRGAPRPRTELVLPPSPVGALRNRYPPVMHYYRRRDWRGGAKGEGSGRGRERGRLVLRIITRHAVNLHAGRSDVQNLSRALSLFLPPPLHSTLPRTLCPPARPSSPHYVIHDRVTLVTLTLYCTQYTLSWECT